MPSPAGSRPASSSAPVSPDDLLTLLAVARLGKFTAAAAALGVNHTTISRRIASLEKAVAARVLVQSPDGWELTATGSALIPAAEAVEAALAGAVRAARPEASPADPVVGTIRLAAPEGFVVHYALPALARLQRSHAGLQLEVLTATQRARRYRSGVDIEVVVGRPDAPNTTVHRLRRYALALFAAADYPLPLPQEPADIAGHRLVYYPAHSLGVDGLENAAATLPEPAGFLTSNSISAQVRATQEGAGIGLLPVFAARAAGLERVVPEFSVPMTYWAAVRPEALRSATVGAVLEALRAPEPAAADTAPRRRGAAG